MQVLRCVRPGVAGYDVNTCDKFATELGSLGCTWMHRRAAPAGPVLLREGVCALLMRCRSASSSVRGSGPRGGSGQRHAATWEHCAHLLVLPA